MLAINASLWESSNRGVRRFRGIARLYGARFGIDGILEEDFLDLFAQSESALAGVSRAPASALERLAAKSPRKIASGSWRSSGTRSATS